MPRHRRRPAWGTDRSGVFPVTSLKKFARLGGARAREHTNGIMRNRTIRTLAAAAAMSVAVPAALMAQQRTDTTAVPPAHTVVKGETLWGLAQQFLANPFRWPEIYQLNKTTIANPHWIYPGQVFKLPGAVTSVTVGVTPPPAAVDTTTQSADTTAKAAAAPPAPADTAQKAAPAAQPTVNTATSPTIFRKPPRVVHSPELTQQKEPPLPTVLRGEYVRAPFATKIGSIRGAGRIIKSGDLDPSGQFEPTTIFKAYDNVLVQLPKGASAKKGDRYLAVSTMRYDSDEGQVAVPTGVVQITRPPEGGAAAVAEVVQLFGEMNPDQLLVPLDTTGVSSTARPKPVTDGRWGTVRWVLGSPVLPTMQSYALLSLTEADGVHPGDQFLIFKPRKASGVPGQAADPEIPVGRAEAIKVTPFGTTAIVTAQEQPAINVGMMVRVSAKMP